MLTLISFLELSNFFLFVAFSRSVFLLLLCLIVQAAVGTAGNENCSIVSLPFLGRVSAVWAGKDRLTGRLSIQDLWAAKTD